MSWSGEYRTLDVAALVRLCAEQCVLNKRTAWPYRFVGTEPLGPGVVGYVRRHPSTSDSYAASLRAGATNVLVFNCNPQRPPAAPLGCDPELESRILHADSCQVAAFALYERLMATERRGEQAVLQSKSRGLLRLARPAHFALQVLSGYPVAGTYTNPLIIMQGPGSRGNMISLLTPDNLATGKRACHTWVCAGFHNAAGELVRVNLDPTLKQFGGLLPSVWFGEDRPDSSQPFRLELAGHEDPSAPRERDEFEATLDAALAAM